MFGNVFHDRLKRTRYVLVRKPGFSRLYDLLLSAKDQIIGGFVRVDACTICQLHCPECPTGRGENRHGVIGWNFLRYENFVKFIQQNPFVKTVELSNWGEIFLNPELGDIIEFAGRKGINIIPPLKTGRLSGSMPG